MDQGVHNANREIEMGCTCISGPKVPKAFVFQLKPACQLGLASHQGSLEEVHLNSTKEII